MGKKKNKRKLNPLFVILILLLLGIAAAGSFLYINIRNGNRTSSYFLASDQTAVTVFNKDGETLDIPRGTLVEIKNRRVKIDETEYCQFAYGDQTWYVSESDLTEDRRDCVRETTLYALRDHVLTTDWDDFHISGWVNKKQELNVTSYHELLEDGSVDYYQINSEGYISSKYTAQEYYETAYDASVYERISG